MTGLAPASPVMPPRQYGAAAQVIVRDPNIDVNNFFIYQLFEILKTVLAMVRGDDNMVKIS